MTVIRTDGDGQYVVYKLFCLRVYDLVGIKVDGVLFDGKLQDLAPLLFAHDLLIGRCLMQSHMLFVF